MIQVNTTLAISLFTTILLIAIFLTLCLYKKNPLLISFALLIVGVMALLSLAQTLELIMI